jgi:hypothetical protein
MRKALALGMTLLTSGCAVFDGPPEVTIMGIQAGLLPDAKAPIVLSFSKPPVPSTVKVEIAKYLVDSEGRLGDEPGNTLGTGLQTIFTYDPVNGNTGGSGVLAPDGSTLTITPSVVPAVGGQLVVLVEPGLSDLQGTVTHVRRRIVFGYASTLDCSMPAHVLQAGTYFLLTNVTQPINVQIQLFGVLEIDSMTGKLKGQFTKAKRNPDGTRCSPACPSTDACRTLPGPPACVTPSTAASTVDEFPDYVPNDDPTTGFTFEAPGCTVDQDMTTATLATSPVDVAVSMPMVTLRNAALDASFMLGSDGTLRGSGTLTADAVLLGTIVSGMGAGNLTARSVPANMVPPGVPQPMP